MIKCDRGGARVEGTTLDTIQDFVNVINAVRVSLEDDMSPDDAAEIMRQCGRLAFAMGEDKDAEAEAYRGITRVLLKNGMM